MQYGVVFPQTEIGTDPAVIRAYATSVEAMGYRHLLVYDHVLGADVSVRPNWRGPYSSETPFHEPFVLFGYLAAITTQLELVTGVLILPQRQTALVAKQAAEVDLLSGGRLRLGIGIGWNEVEYQGLNEQFANRGRRSEEQIALLRELWSRPVVNFAGRWHTIEAAGINPLPVQRPIPIWIGGGVDATLERVGRLGDGWFPQRPPDARAAEMIAELRRHTLAAGRPVEAVGIEARLSLSLVPAEQRAGFIQGWRDLGATHLSVNTMGLGYRSVDQHLAALQQVRELFSG